MLCEDGHTSYIRIVLLLVCGLFFVVLLLNKLPIKRTRYRSNLTLYGVDVCFSSSEIISDGSLMEVVLASGVVAHIIHTCVAS